MSEGIDMSDDEPMFTCGKPDCGKAAYTSTFWCDDHDPLEERDRYRAALVEIAKGKTIEDNDHPLGEYASMAMRWLTLAQRTLDGGVPSPSVTEKK